MDNENDKERLLQTYNHYQIGHPDCRSKTVTFVFDNEQDIPHDFVDQLLKHFGKQCIGVKLYEELHMSAPVPEGVTVVNHGEPITVKDNVVDLLEWKAKKNQPL